MRERHTRRLRPHEFDSNAQFGGALWEQCALEQRKLTQSYAGAQRATTDTEERVERHRHGQHHGPVDGVIGKHGKPSDIKMHGLRAHAVTIIEPTTDDDLRMRAALDFVDQCLRTAGKRTQSDAARREVPGE